MTLAPPLPDPDRATAARWTALVLAGSRPGVDPVAAAFSTRIKALVPVGGTPMLVRVVETLAAVPAIRQILIVAQEPDRLAAEPALSALTARPNVRFVASGASIATSVRAVVEREGDAVWPVLVTTADHALLTPAMVTAFLNGADANGTDLSVALVPRAAVERAVPDTQRTWLRFSDGAFTGANLFALRTPAVAAALSFWSTVEAHRKQPWRIALHIGPGLLVGTLLRRLSLAGTLSRLGRRFGVTAAPVLMTEGEAGIDVDKPADHALAERLLAARA